MEVARLAGLGKRVEPKVNSKKEEEDGGGGGVVGERLGMFESEFLDEDDDEGALDVRVRFD